MMTKYTKTIGALAATAALTGGYALAGPFAAPMAPAPAPVTSCLTGELNVGYTSMYEFRFVDLGQDLVSAGADIAYDFGNGWAINGGAWYGSVNDTNNIRSLDFNELDVYAGISKSFGMVNFEVGYVFYHFMDLNALDTQDIYGSLGLDFGSGFGANVTAFYDIQRYNGLYATTELTYSLEFSSNLSLDLAAGVGYADGHGLQLSRQSVFIGGNPGGTVDGYQGWYASAALPWAATENLTITPFIKYTDGDSDLLTNVTNFQSGEDHFYGGVTLAVSF